MFAVVDGQLVFDLRMLPKKFNKCELTLYNYGPSMEHPDGGDFRIQLVFEVSASTVTGSGDGN
jgi:hypothetical protein